ncbi:MAG TPA: TIGR00730 family Rossman fold protein [Rhodobacteraceae bacterium]|jgi:uncharacterized protein (TIGR00730 family)|nr:TIGR00730 family Rossman fold protein [Paracoccaceae bacterium]HBG97416.1 TIGR00730 family Rossman fold protein [Paracoccaceae bacterium]
MPAQTRAICVFCGSRDGRNPAWRAAAEATGRGLAEAGYHLIYGAGDSGLMGAVAAAADAAGGTAMGVIPTHLMQREGQGRDAGRLIVTETMHERKKVMIMNADAIVVLPGGPGTLDEFFEMATWRQLGLHAKPIYLVNIAGYWDPLVALVDHVVAQGFAEASFRDYVTVVEDVPALFDRLARDLSSRQSAAE